MKRHSVGLVSFFVLQHIIVCGLFKAEAIFVEEHERYYLRIIKVFYSGGSFQYLLIIEN